MILWFRLPGPHALVKKSHDATFLCCFFVFVPTLGVGLLEFKLNSSPRPVYFSSPGLRLAQPQGAQPESVPGVPAQPQSPTRVSLECPTPPLSVSGGTQPQSVPGVPNPRVSLPKEGGDVRSDF